MNLASLSPFSLTDLSINQVKNHTNGDNETCVFISFPDFFIFWTRKKGRFEGWVTIELIKICSKYKYQWPEAKMKVVNSHPWNGDQEQQTFEEKNQLLRDLMMKEKITFHLNNCSSSSYPSSSSSFTSPLSSSSTWSSSPTQDNNKKISSSNRIEGNKGTTFIPLGESQRSRKECFSSIKSATRAEQKCSSNDQPTVGIKE